MAEHVPKNIVILGAGVAGLRVALDLEKKINSELARIILIDENDYHQYLYRIQMVCNIDYGDDDIVVPISRLIKGKRIEFIQASVKKVDTERRIVETTTGEIPYDKLAVTLGSHIEYFNVEGLKENSLSLSSFEAAKSIRARTQELFEEAEQTGNPPKIVIGGGGFTGVELAGEIADWYPILCEEHKIEKPEIYVTMVEMMPTILTGWNKDLIHKAQKDLGELRVELLLGDAVARVDKRRIETKSGNIIEPDLFVWNGGVRGDSACGEGFETKRGRILIDEYCRARGFDDVYVAGDQALTVDKEGRSQPPTAHIAMVQGAIIAHNIIASVKGGKMKPYVFDRIGEIVTLGKTDAVGDLFGIKFTGILAKFMKKLVHWWYLFSIGGLSLLFGS